MLHSLPSAINNALDTLYNPNAVFSQFLGSASMTFFSLFLSMFPRLVLPFLAFLVFSVLFLYFLFSCFLSINLLFFPVIIFPIDLRLSCVCVA